MTVSISKVHLLNVERGEPEPAELWDANTEQQITDWENGWMPELHSAMNRLRHTGVEDSQWPESSHWDGVRRSRQYGGCLLVQASALSVMA